MLNLAGDDALKINSVSLCNLLWALKRDGWTQGSSQDIPDRASTQQVWEMGPRAEYHIPQQLQRAAKPLTTPHLLLRTQPGALAGLGKTSLLPTSMSEASEL